jgi:hypothetical protein
VHCSSSSEQWHGRTATMTAVGTATSADTVRTGTRSQDLGKSVRARENLGGGIARGRCLDDAGHAARGEP